MSHEDAEKHDGEDREYCLKARMFTCDDWSCHSVSIGATLRIRPSDRQTGSYGLWANSLTDVAA
jgi:hypothetical protein